MEEQQPSGPHQALSNFASSLHTKLFIAGPLTNPLLSPNDILYLDEQLNINPFTTQPESGNDQLDVVGTSLWNDCNELIVSRGHNRDDVLLLSKVKAFAFALLNMAVLPDILGSLRSLSLALKAALRCIMNEQRDIALNILRVAAMRLEGFHSSELEAGLDPGLKRALTTQYNLLRARLSWLQHRPDISEYFFAKIPVPELAENGEFIFENCFIIGDSALMQVQGDVAVKWLQRASDYLEALYHKTHFQYQNYHNWNLVIRHSIAVACVQTRSSEFNATYDIEMINLRHAYPGHPAVVLLDLFMDHNPPKDGRLQALSSVVDKMTLTAMNMPIIFQYARSLGNASGPENSMEALRLLLISPLPAGEWTEKCLVAFTLLLSRSCIWKMTGEAILKKDYRSAHLWLQLCSDSKIFQNCSQYVQVAIHKRLLAFYLHTEDLNPARQLMDRGLVQSQVDCGRMYLSYKLTLLEGKDGAGHFFLGFPLHPVPHKQISLLSCAMEAQRQRKQKEVLNCLEQFISCLTSDDIYHDDFSAAEHHMFAIIILLKEVSRGFSQRLGNCIQTVLQSALSYAKKNSTFEGGDKQVSATQLQWFYSATYKLALGLMRSPGVSLTVPVLNFSKDFALQYREIAYPKMGSGAPRPHLFAVYYLLILATTFKARRATDQTEKMVLYENVRAYAQELNSLHGWCDGEEQLDDHTNKKEDMHHEIAQFFDLEAAMCLRNWEDVARICASDDEFPKSKFHTQIMDMTFYFDLPPRLAIEVIKRIMAKLSEQPIDPPTTWRRDFRISLPRYLHCLFALAIKPIGDIDPAMGFFDIDMADAEVAEGVLDRILAMASEVPGGGEPGYSEMQDLYFSEGFTYPAAELIHIASAAFNAATDFYRATRDADCQRWAEKAIRIARLVRGLQGTELVQTLHARLGALIGV
ncbi:Meiosis specific protein SPO22 [Penicillium griseofulvum]|uniref:Meiosis specific protein SPO22 n=1 Tax=Penicillium patulum TaxID=5078 RepID=A0A135LNM0_PENPA|nr:Meiosis specific protein SPO22 [Penicillium griseofulvum]KXG50567.1 Meiosis specific protein SPO22 [Penicillium griseofulvum]